MKADNESLNNKVKEKVGTVSKVELHQFKKKSKHITKDIKFTKSKNHVGSKEESDKMSEATLKRKRPMEDDPQNGEEKTSFEVDNLCLLKLRKRKNVNIEYSKNATDTLGLDLSKEHILQCISAIFHLTKEQLKNKNALFQGENHSIFLQVTCMRIPKTPRRNMRILLPHSIVSSNDEVALFVGDLQKGRRKDYEPTIEYYEDLLKKHGCTLIKSIIPMNQVKTEYDQFELKRKLVGSYDHFLVDGKIAGHLTHLLGKEFYKKRKLPTSIRMKSKDLKHEVEYALRKSSMQLHSFGDTHLIQIGHTSMKEEEVLENVLAACSRLSKNYPGGWANIRSMHIKTTSSLALPIYMTLRNKNSVEVPAVQPKRPKAYHNVKGELSTMPGLAFVTVNPEGKVTVKKNPENKE